MNGLGLEHFRRGSSFAWPRVADSARGPAAVSTVSEWIGHQLGQCKTLWDSGRGGPGVSVDPTGSGDVSQTHIRWTVTQAGEALCSPIIVGRHVYRLHKPGLLKCWELAGGKQVYAERLDGISTTWASPIADANGRIFFANAGKSYVIQAGPEFRVLAVNDLGDGNHPSPAVARGRLFLVGTKDLYCVGSRK